MMAFWAENQRQSPQYVKFGTVPGRNFHDKHQTAHYPLYFCEQQNRGRESRTWTAPGSRTGGALQEYTNWTDADLTTPTSHFPFILDQQSQHLQDLAEYQPQESRIAGGAQQAARECERGMLREGWQRRWEPCSPVQYQREISKRSLSDSSFRELEAWAARYSHSLPRRRRIEAELSGASHGLLEGNWALERDSRSGTDPRVAALHQARVSAHNREVGQLGRDRKRQQHTMTHHPSQAPVPDTSHMLDIRDKSDYRRRMFSHPPCYNAPPPYNSPHKSSPIMHRHSASWEQEGKIQTCYSQDVSVDLQNERGGQKAEGAYKTCYELEGSNQRWTTDALQANNMIHIQNMQMKRERLSSLPQSQTLQTILNTYNNVDASSKVIEGRKFKLDKNTGGMTIFCLVSRIADMTEGPSCSSQTNTESAETGQVSKAVRDSGDFNHTPKLEDEVDFKVSSLRNLKSKQNVTQTWLHSEQAASCEKPMLQSNKTETDMNSTFGKQVGHSSLPVSAKYPLWREPSFINRAETESSSPYYLKVNREGEESNGFYNRDDSHKVSSRPIDIEVRRLDIKKDTESEESSGLLVIDTTCVVVKMDLIASPNKEHVQYLGSSPAEHSPVDTQSDTLSDSIQSSNHLNQDVITDQSKESSTQRKHLMNESEISLPCTASALVCEQEILEERAEKILGIPVRDCDTEHKPKDAKSILDQHEEGEASPLINNNFSVALEQLSKDTIEDQVSGCHSESGQADNAACLKESNDNEEQVTNEDSEDVSCQDQISNISKGNDVDCQAESDIKALQETEGTQESLLVSNSEEVTSELSQKAESESDDDDGDDDDASPLHSAKCLSLYTNHCNSSLLSPSHSNLTSPACVSNVSPNPESTANLAPDPDSLSNTFPFPHLESHTKSQQCPSPLTPESSQSSTPRRAHSPSPLPLDLLGQTADAMSTANQGEEGATSLINSEISDVVEHLAKVTLEEKVSQQQFDLDEAEDDACIKESDDNEELLTKEYEEEFNGVLDQMSEISKEDATDCQLKVKILSGTEPPTEISDSSPSHLDSTDYKTSQFPLDVSISPSPHPSQNVEPAALLEMTLVCPSDDNVVLPEAPEVFPPFHLNSGKQSDQLPSPPLSEPAPLLPPSSTAPQQENTSVSSDFLSSAQQSQCPKSLLDAVNRIRKHTAPNSENEEEEMSELWDPESLGDDTVFLDEVVDLNSEDVTPDSSDGLQEGSMSSSSDTRITTGEKLIFDETGQLQTEDKAEEVTPDAEIQSQTENEDKAQAEHGGESDKAEEEDTGKEMEKD
ncbi:hypothetical protein LDENG_00295030 [Lucifuga dentata]|nr:hypothetical protein LDENG_00295030 [Lucifuga dentata]